ncbi:hypothetical protein PAT3040_05749 [Paenibacillus agaridevorans]|uniref:Uncharacterized protein n=1 Tax=Paenibacillus agaridevorans TaxID=171404 RepID=A0A2R5EXY0_9BACL|nr:hypothetical protein PAT3040_05749 [Paenibacillus agaridevorans]
MHSFAESSSDEREPFFDPARTNEFVVVFKPQEHEGMDDGFVYGHIGIARFGAGADEMERFSY